jgi:release factor glutamine methyltransferase
MNLSVLSKKLHSSLEARILLSHITGLSETDLITTDSINLDEKQKKNLDDMILKRLNGRPLSKIIGLKEFYGLEFLVNDDVLDPRPDSEILIDAVLKYADKQKPYKILDLGTGSGCLILTLLSHLPHASGYAVDFSEKALAVARKNAVSLGLENRTSFIQSNWLESVDGTFDIIVSNPPYIETKTIDDLQVEVKNHDPILALDGGNDGLNPYRVILPQIRTYLNHGGFVAFEHSSGQVETIKRLIENQGFRNVQQHHDYAGHDRILSFIGQ